MAISQDTTVYRGIVYRLIPGTRARARSLASLAGACRYVWNELLDQQEALYLEARSLGTKPPTPTFFTLGQGFKQLRDATPWLQELPMAPVRYTLKYQADAWRAYFRGHGGRPRFKSRRGDDSVTLPQDIRIRSGKLYIPRLGAYVLRRRGGNPYPAGRPVRATIRRCLERWYCTVTYAVPADSVQPIDNGLALGVDMNVGQVAVSTGDILRAPDTSRLEARRRRYQRMMARRCRGSKRRAVARHRAAKTSRRIARIRHNWHHHVSRVLADTAGLVCVEALNTKAMTASAKGTMDEPGTNVRQKSGLNRTILATGWHQLRQMLDYKATHVVAIPPAFTSQTCHRCGVVDATSRKSQSRYECGHCGYTGNADTNAALNIQASGTGASGRRGALVLQGHSNDPSKGVSDSVLAEFGT